MKFQVTVTAKEITNIIGQHLVEKFKHLAGRGEYVTCARIGDFPRDIIFVLEACPEPFDDR